MSRTGVIASMTFREGVIRELVMRMDDGARITLEFEPVERDFWPLNATVTPPDGRGVARVKLRETPAWAAVFVQDSP